MRGWRLRTIVVCALGVVLSACSADDGTDDGAPGGGGGAGSSGTSAGAGTSGGGAGGSVAGAGGAAGQASGGASGAGRGGAGSAGTSAGSGGTDASDAGAADAGGGDASTLAAMYPGDVGLGDDPAVVWLEDFEHGSIDALVDRYDQVQGQDRFTLVGDTPSGEGSALAMRAGQGQDAVDLYKQLPDADEWYVRWYARYEQGVPWHHSGMWFGGYAPAMPWPSPMAGNRPNGDDRFSISIEPVYGTDGASPRFDYYNYWMRMHSWMAEPVNDDGTAYYGNGLVHRSDFTVDPESWVCLEVHVRLNPDPGSGDGAVLEVWKDDALMRRFDDDGPMGWWIRDKFCPADSDGSECTDYPAPAIERLDLQFRSTPDLRLNAFWPQNYVTDDAMGTLTFDQMVVATRRVGCMR